MTLLEFYVLVSSAVLFSRGALQKSGYNQWTLDGFVISLFPICAIFILFTFSLLITHFYLLCTNQSTIDHLAFSRISRKEEFALADYAKRVLQKQKQQTSSSRTTRRSSPAPGANNPFTIKRKLKKEWDHKWGRLKWEINLWKVEHFNETTSQWEKSSTFKACLANWKQSMGDQWWMWIRELRDVVAVLSYVAIQYSSRVLMISSSPSHSTSRKTIQRRIRVPHQPASWTQWRMEDKRPVAKGTAVIRGSSCVYALSPFLCTVLYCTTAMSAPTHQYTILY